MVTMIEGGVEYFLNRPSILGGPLLKILRLYYETYDRSIIQLMPDCAQYDEKLTYTLKPGKCSFKNREFNIDIQVNSLGLRDDEASLASPDIVIVGDSYAMGWGMDHNKTFAHIIKEETGMTVLNAAIPSYGTVREIKILERIDLSKLKFLIIQYDDNDYEENITYYNNNNVLPIASKAEYESIVMQHMKNRKYYLGKHTFDLFPMLFEMIKKQFLGWQFSAGSMQKTNTDTAAAFINAIINSPIKLKNNVSIIVFNVNTYHNNNLFTVSLNRIKSTETFPNFIKNMTIIDISEFLTSDKFFILDDHLSSQGHKLIADNLIRIINQQLNISTR
jgi:hypothetical protein